MIREDKSGDLRSQSTEKALKDHSQRVNTYYKGKTVERLILNSFGGNVPRIPKLQMPCLRYVGESHGKEPTANSERTDNSNGRKEYQGLFN